MFCQVEHMEVLTSRALDISLSVDEVVSIVQDVLNVTVVTNVIIIVLLCSIALSLRKIAKRQ